MSRSEQTSPAFHALLIAADCYLPNQLDEGSYPSLRGCVRDVRRVEDFLTRRLALTGDHLITLTSTNTGAAEPPETPHQRPTYENMVRAFQQTLDRARAGDQVYIHYSGHGGRTPTIAPKVKGALELDEALVPVDIGSSSARYLRDVELARLLREMVAKGLVVTLVLDCCHSGGMSRGPDAAVRGVAFVDRTTRPADSLVAPPDELGAGWHDLTGGSAPHSAAATTRNLATLETPRGYVLLAACRPSERAYEYAFDGHEVQGALTYWLLDTLEQIAPGLTYKTVYDRLLARIHSQFERQTPLLQGDSARVVFGTDRIRSAFATPVMAVDATARSVVLNTGQAANVRKGAQFIIYPRGTLDFSQTYTRIASVQIAELGASESRADILQTFGPKVPEPGDQAVLVGAGAVKLVRKVRLLRADGEPATTGDTALEKVKKALPGNGWVELTETAATPADFIVTVSGDGRVYEICDGSGQAINLRPELPTATPGAPQGVVDRLVHLTKYRATRELENFDAASPLRGRLVVELLGVQDDFDPADNPDPRPFPPGPVPTLRPGQWTFLRVKNTAEQVLNVSVLDLQPDWGISLYPPLSGNQDFDPLDPRREPLIFPMRASLPEGYDQGTDVAKVIATVGVTSFQPLCLPSLDRPIPKGVVPRGTQGSTNPLDQLIAAIAADQPATRTLTPSATPSREWTVTQLEVRIES
jgi:Caspase domain